MSLRLGTEGEINELPAYDRLVGNASVRPLAAFLAERLARIDGLMS